MDDLLQYWKEIIERDLKGFADPRTEVEVRHSNRNLIAKWVYRGRDRTASFRLTPEGDFRWQEEGEIAKAEPYRKFLLSEAMADFTQLSSAISQAFCEEPHYVPTKAIAESSPSTSESDVLLRRVVTESLESGYSKTRLVFVKGDAGSGKSTLLRQITGEQARMYKRGNSNFLFMYVSAQGRALSNLRDAISGELDDLRAGFTRDAVPTLVRHGLLVLIVDGFDELLGAAGYGDAFGSLQQFLSQVDGQGALVVSARSAFYDIEFVGRHTTTELAEAKYDVEPITISPWSDEDLHKYLSRVRGGSVLTEKDRRGLAALSEQDRELLSKPFFASLFPHYVDAKEGVGHRSLLDYLVDAYVERESGKIVDKDGRPLVPVETHKRLFIEATEAMWSYESRDLSEDDLRALAELTAGSSQLPSDTAQQFTTKITSYHGFQTSKNNGQRRFRFEHEVYFDYFLSRTLREWIDKPAAITTFLDKGLIPVEVFRSAVDSVNALRCFSLASSIPKQGVLKENRRRNLGSLVAAAFAISKQVSDLELADLSFINVSFGDVDVRQVRFYNCIFNNVGWERAKFQGCTFVDSDADRIRVSSMTKLGIEGFMPGANLRCIQTIEDGQETYVPSEMVEILLRLGAPGMKAEPPQYSSKGQAVVNLLHRVVQKFRRTNVLCMEDENLRRLFADPNWRLLYNLLLQHSIVEEEVRQTSGTRKIFLRPQVAILDMMHHETTPVGQLPEHSIGSFWRGVRSL